jgi:phosphate transport system substrate-binding protein
MKRSKLFIVLVAIAGMIAAACGKSTPSTSSSGSSITPASSLTGAGSTFAAPLYQQWGVTYQAEHSVEVSYDSVGSGAGITDITQKTVDFGASDASYTPTETAAATILNIPTAISAVVITYNMPNLKTTLNFSGQTLVDIFSAKVTKWNDPEIAADNPGVSLPSQPITVVHRSDGSGTTAIFTTYLSAESATWKSTYGSGTTVAWPTSELGGKGSTGVEADITQTPYSIGYVELTYAVQNKTPAAGVKNGDGTADVTPTVTSVLASVSKLQPSQAPSGDNVIFTMLNEPGAGSYPIAGPTYLLVYQQQTNASIGKALTDFMTWGLTVGQTEEAALDYVQLPTAIQQRALAAVDSITYNGTPLASPTS